MWNQSKTIIKHSELLIGRIYRRYLDDGRAKIRFVTFNIDKPEDIGTPKWAQPNDPLYLMHNTSCPGDPPHLQKGEPMFIPWGEEPYEEIPVIFRGQEHHVKVRYAIAKSDIREGHNPGSRDHGQHAKKNVGLSIIRADRELHLDPGLVGSVKPKRSILGCRS